ncbi:Cytochrome P450 6k1 [Atta colombica]|uniref:Cytochrome P450 6k1 n=1 Tax=Atta colombica TaxID=520822 RepID=A0A195AVR3_9HYME|nr:Cytochrome P450 6k1 [Atta colombica]
MAILYEYALLDALVIFSSLFATLYLWMKWKHTYWQRHGVPTLSAHWFFGHFKDAILAENEDVLGIYILHKPFLHNTIPDSKKSRTDKNSDTISKWNLFSIYYPEWKSKMTLVFTSGKLKSLFQLMQESGEKRDHLHNQIKDNSKIVSIKVKDTFYKYITDVISSVAFGSTRFFRKIFWDIDSLLQLKTETPDNMNMFVKFEGDALLAQAAIFFVADRETSIVIMICALFELAKQPEMQRRVREEIHNDVTYEALHNMKYLHQVINETPLWKNPIDPRNVFISSSANSC